MQFFPTIAPTSSVPPLGGDASGMSSYGKFGGQEGSGSDFLQSLNKELAAAGITPVVDVSVEGKLPTGFRVLSHDRKATLDSDDIAFITGKLKKRGVKEPVLTGIEGLIQAGATPTIGTVMASVTKRERVSEPLTDNERMSLRGALAKLELPTEAMEEVEAFMDSGQGDEALRLINKNVGNLSSSGITLERQETLALLRGLDLSEKTRTETRPLLGKDTTASFNSADLERILGPASKQFAQDRADRETMAAELKGIIDEALHAKKMREASAQTSDARGSRQSERAAIRMRDDLTAKAGELGKNVIDQARKADKDLLETDPLMGDTADEDERDHTAGEDAAQRRLTTLMTEGRAATKQSGVDVTTTAAKDGFLSALDRIETPTAMTMPLQSHGAMAPGAMQPTQQALAHRGEIFAQVEQGMLRQVQNGSHQLTLRLDPAELGHISLVLSVKGDEVRATIRAENAETAAVLSDQMGSLRASLEEQGLKVTELTVETQLPHDTTKGQEWTGTAQYNQEQELREQARFVRLAKIRRGSGTDLAQDMQSKGTREEIAAQGLHIIA